MFVSVKRPTEDARPSPYRGPDRRSRTLGLAGRLPAAQVLPMTLLVGVGAGIRALFLIPRQPDAATVTSYLLVAAGLLSVVAGGAGLVSWRIVGHALQGWLGSAFVCLGVLMLITSGLGGFGIGPVPATEPADVLVSALLAGGLVWRGVTATEVESGFSPLVTLATSIGAGVSVAGISSALQVDRLVPWWISGQVARPVLSTVAGAAWLAVATRAAWSAGRVLGVPMWISLITGLIGIGTLLRADPQLGAGAGLTGAVVVFCAMSLVLGTVLARVQSVLRIEDHQQFRLHRALAGTRRQAASEHEELEEWLHDLRNAVAGLRAADAVLRAGAGSGSGSGSGLAGREPLAEAVTAELARLHALVGSPRAHRSSDLDLGSVLAPVVAAERMLGTQIDADFGGLHAFADQGALSRVVQNVLENARRYAPSSRVVVTAREVGPRVQITIRDFGPGIPEAERGAVFGRAERGTSSAGTVGGGLGLHVAQSLLSAMGARAWITDDSPGCCVLVTLPRIASVAGVTSAAGVAGGRGKPAPAYGPGRLPAAV